jgi:MFS transporter, ACS family, hexuronate transporter
MAGGLGGMAVSIFAGRLFDHYKNLGSIETGYLIMFIACGLAYIVAWTIIHLLVPTMKPIKL